MKPPVQIPPPILNLSRWLAASITNIVQLDHGAKVVGDAPLPTDIVTSLETEPAASWGELLQLASSAAANGLVQLAQSILAHPFVTIAVLWWAYESSIQLRTLIRWLHRKDDDDHDKPD